MEIGPQSPSKYGLGDYDCDEQESGTMIQKKVGTHDLCEITGSQSIQQDDRLETSDSKVIHTQASDTHKKNSTIKSASSEVFDFKVADTSVGQAVVMRGKNDSKQRNSFKTRARLSQMLRYESTSSSEDDTYTIMTSALRQRGDQSDPPDYSEAGVSKSSKPRSPPPTLQSDATISDADDARRESVPMHILREIVKPEVLSDVKAHLKKVAAGQTSTDNNEQSPAKLWELRKQRRIENHLDKAQAGKIKAGWRVRQCLNSLPAGETVNSFYLTCVKKGLVREVDALFSLAKIDRNIALNKDYKDDNEKSALILAVEARNTALLGMLLEYGVELGLCIFHIIALDFMDGLKLLMDCCPCVNAEIKEENHYFQIGMTPMLLAAHNNNYRMLSVLHEHGHRLTTSMDWSEGIHEAWESANERRMLCKARAQPAYITLMTEVNRMNPMKYCIKEIKKMKRYQTQEHEFSSFYKEVIDQLEDYMCCLLDYVCSSEDLAHLFQYEYKPVTSAGSIKTFLDGATTRWEVENRFQLLEKASKEHLVRFVTHQQSQLALSYLRYRAIPFLRSRRVVLRNIFSITLGMLFPILSMFYILAPKSKLGSIITLPTISFSCHMMSDVIFALLLLLNVSTKDVSSYYLGAPPTLLEYLILVWVLGKWVQEIQECMNRGMKSYLGDNWNYTDIILLVLFTICIIFRIVDLILNTDKETQRIPRSEWESSEPRLVAEGLQAWAYVFVFLRLLGIMRVDRNLGPLQISLARMLSDILRFLCIFLLVICAFAFGLSELYWYYGTEDGAKMFCAKIGNTTEDNTICNSNKKIPFSSMGYSIINLFWALFGLLELDDLSLSGKHAYTERVGRTLVAVYHAVAIIVMLNMLIAMMSKSYEDTSENEETEWKFHRTSMWIRFIRREVIRPPPMNLFPNPWRLKENFARLKCCCRRICCRDSVLTEGVYDKHGRRIHGGKRKSLNLSSREDSLSSPVAERKHTEGAGESGNLTTHEDMKKTVGTSYTSSKIICCYSKKNTDEIKLTNEIEQHDTLDMRSDVRFATRKASKDSLRKADNRAGGRAFKSAALTGVHSAIRLNFRADNCKAVLTKLVRRYKLKNLISDSSK